MKDVKGTQKGEEVNTAYWDALWKEYQPINAKKVRNYFYVFDFYKLPKSTSIVDIGCGDGQTLIFLKEKGFKNVSGIEPEGRLFKGTSLNIIEDNLLDMKRVRKKHDAVLVFGVLHHLHTLEEMKTALRNIKSVLKKGGKFYSVEQWKNVIRTLAMWLVKDTPFRHVNRTTQIEHELLKQEWPELSYWLKVEKEVTAYAESIGLKIVFYKRDVRYRYIIFERI